MYPRLVKEYRACAGDELFIVRFSLHKSKQPFPTFHQYLHGEPRFVDKAARGVEYKIAPFVFSLIKQYQVGEI